MAYQMNLELRTSFDNSLSAQTNMLRFFYRWRYRRAQKIGSFKLPSKHKDGGRGSVDLGSYLSQSSVRGRNFDRFDLPNKGRKGLFVLIVILLLLTAGWIILESVSALELFRD